jgi:hypothetical protein
MIAARKSPEVPGDRNGKCHACSPWLQDLYQGTRAEPFAWCAPKGHSAPFPIYAAARDGFATQQTQAEGCRALSNLFECPGGAPDRKRKLAVGGDGRGEVLHLLHSPVSARAGTATPATSVVSPRAAEPTRLRNHHPPPEEQTPSQNRSRLGPGNHKHLSHQQSNCLLRMSQTGRRLRYVCDELSAVCICVLAYAPQSGMERQKPSR